MSTETTDTPRQELMPSPVREAAQIERQRAMAETTFGQGISPFSNGDAFKLACAMAERIAMSTFVPKEYQGNPENVLVAMDYAARLGVGLMTMMQNMDVVHGRPGLRGAFLAGLINASPVFSRLKFEWRGEDNPGGEPSLDFGCRAYATEAATGDVIVGTWIDWRMVKAEKWNNNAKWTSMRVQMFQYRAAAFWTRAHASDITLGLQTTEELQDVSLKADYERIENSAGRLARTVDEAIERRESDVIDVEAGPVEPAKDEKPRGRRVARRTREEAPTPDPAAIEHDRSDAIEQQEEQAVLDADDRPPFDMPGAEDPKPDEAPAPTARPALTLE